MSTRSTSLQTGYGKVRRQLIYNALIVRTTFLERAENT